VAFSVPIAFGPSSFLPAAELPHVESAQVAVFGLPMLVIGVVPVPATYLPVMIMASWIGNWLFYVQHQLEGTYWEPDGDWNFHAAALQGSSYFKLPPILRSPCARP